MKPHLSAIVIPALVFTLFACKSKQDKAADAAQVPSQSLEPKQDAQAPQQSQVQITEFQEDWDVIPKDFDGDDINAVFNALKSEKGEFESSADYLSRLKSIAEKKEKFVFKSDIDPKYDADKERYIIEFSYNNHSVSFSVKPPDRTWDSRGIIAVNELSVKKKSENQRSIMLSTWRIVRYFNIPSTEAPTYKGKFRALFICKIVPTQGETNPYLIYGSRLSTNLEAIWLYEEVTGKVFEKISFND